MGETLSLHLARQIPLQQHGVLAIGLEHEIEEIADDSPSPAAGGRSGENTPVSAVKFRPAALLNLVGRDHHHFGVGR
nr:hypothetical protein [Methyloceanibacter superfactus]